MQTRSPQLSCESGNKRLLGDSTKLALTFYSHSKYANENEEQEDILLGFDRRTLSNLHEEPFVFTGIGCQFAGLEPGIMSAYIGEKFLCSEALYQAN